MPTKHGGGLARGEEIGVPKDEGEEFMFYYVSVGWTVGKDKKPMDSWRGAMGGWNGRWKKQNPGRLPNIEDIEL